jgi:hypothetical protein
MALPLSGKDNLTGSRGSAGLLGRLRPHDRPFLLADWNEIGSATLIPDLPQEIGVSVFVEGQVSGR